MALGAEGGAVAGAAHDALAGRPANGLGIPLSLYHIVKVHQVVHHGAACHPPQDGGDHGPVGGGAWAESGGIGA